MPRARRCKADDSWEGVFGKMVAWARAAVAGAGLHGNVSFYEASPKTVHVVARIVGFERNETGFRGFHVHQYGDLRLGPLTTTESVGTHFTPVCAARNGTWDETCEQLQTHGYPPSAWRRSGELGNLSVSGGVGTYDYWVRQEKLSLVDEWLSILGRSIVVHERRDDGSQPWGNSGGVASGRRRAFLSFGVRSPLSGSEGCEMWRGAHVFIEPDVRRAAHLGTEEQERPRGWEVASATRVASRDPRGGDSVETFATSVWCCEASRPRA